MTPTTSRDRSIEGIVFTAVFVGFAAVIVVSALALRPGPQLMPLLVGVPVLIGGSIQLIRELWPPQADESHEREKDVTRNRRLGFAAWALAVVVVGATLNFYIAVAGGLVVILVATRVRWWVVVIILVGALAIMYFLFESFLNVRF